MPTQQPERQSAKVVRPVASPVDRFERTAAGQGLSQLSQALSSVAPSLARFAEAAHDKNLRDAQTQAETDVASSESRDSYNKAIKNGLISPSESPYYRAYAAQAVGKASAMKYAGDLAGYQNSLRGLPPEKYDAAVAEFRRKWLSENGGADNEDFLKGFSATATGVEYERRTSFLAKANEDLIATATNGLYETVRGGIDVELNNSLAGPETLNDRVAAIVSGETRDAVAHGIDGTQANDAATQAVLDWAVLNGRPDVIAALKKVITNPNAPGANLYNRQAMAEKIKEATRQATSALSAKSQTEEDLAAAQSKQAMNELQGKLISSVITHTADPSWKIETDDQFVSLGKLEGGAALQGKLITFRKQLAEAGDYSDQETYNNLRTKVWLVGKGYGTYTAQDLIRDINDDGGISSADADRLLRDIADRDVNRSRQLENNPTLDASVSRSRILFDKFYKGDGSAEAERAFDESMRADWLRWRTQEGKDATEIQQEEWVARREKLLLAKYLPAGVARKVEAMRRAQDAGKPVPSFPTVSSKELAALRTVVRDKKATDADLQLLAENGVDVKDPKAIERFVIVQAELLNQWPDN